LPAIAVAEIDNRANVDSTNDLGLNGLLM
jgi:hypothetical protein